MKNISWSNRIESYPSWLYPLSIACLFIILRPFKFMGLGTSGDSIRLWYHVRQLSAGVEIVDATHHTVRFGILFPTRIIEFIFGNNPCISIVTPFLFSILIIFLLYFFIEKYIGKFYSFCFVLVFSSISSFLHGSTILLPSIFSSLYIICMFLMLYKYFEGGKSKYIIFSALFMFFAYGTKVPNLSWAFGVVIGLLLTGRMRGLFIFSSCLLVLYAAEHALLYYLFDEPLGRLGIIIKKHTLSILSQSDDVFSQHLNKNASFIQKMWVLIEYKFLLLKKYLIFVVPALISALWGLTSGDRFIKVLSISLLFFYLFTIFGIKSYEPLVVLQPNRIRYIYCTFPMAFILLAYVFKYLTSRMKVPINKPIIKFSFLFFAAILYVTSFSLTNFRIKESRGYLKDLTYYIELNRTIPHELKQGTKILFPEELWTYGQEIEGINDKHYWWIVALFLPDDMLFSNKMIFKEVHDCELNEDMNCELSYDGVPFNGKYMLIVPKKRTLTYIDLSKKNTF